MSFTLDPRLAADGPIVADLPLCRVLLKDDARWPWLILVPRLAGLREVFDLMPEDQARLAHETALLAHLVAAEPGVTKVNVGALGNMVPQLHVHVIGRSPTDPAWPGPAWGVGASQPLGTRLKGERHRLAAALASLQASSGMRST